MNRGFADATCNLVTAVMLPLEPNVYSSCTEGPRTVLFGQQSRQALPNQAVRKARRNYRFAIFYRVWLSPARFAMVASLPRFHVAPRRFNAKRKVGNAGVIPRRVVRQPQNRLSLSMLFHVWPPVDSTHAA
jgi:hypothetical protein